MSEEKCPVCRTTKEHNFLKDTMLHKIAIGQRSDILLLQETGKLYRQEIEQLKKMSRLHAIAIKNKEAIEKENDELHGEVKRLKAIEDRVYSVLWGDELELGDRDSLIEVLYEFFPQKNDSKE